MAAHSAKFGLQKLNLRDGHNAQEGLLARKLKTFGFEVYELFFMEKVLAHEWLRHKQK